MRTNKLPSGNTKGLLIEGITLADLDSPDLRAELVDLWLQGGLLVFRGDNNTALHVELSKVFGDLEQHPVKEFRVENFPDLIEISYRPGVDTIVDVDGTELGAWIPWHTDLIYRDRVNRGGMLRCIVAPEAGGRTGFIDKALTWDTLPEDLKERIAGRNVVYKMGMRFDRHRFAYPGQLNILKINSRMQSMIDREDIDFPPSVHPAVFVHPQSGKTILNVSPMFATRIEGMDEAESEKVLRRVANHIFREDFAYFHEWSVNDMVLWDNWRMFHRATGVEPHCHRTMQRTTIAGDYRDALPAAQAA